MIKALNNNTNTTISYTTFNFPVGEMHLQLSANTKSFFAIAPGHTVDVTFIFEKNEDIVELLLFCNAIREARMKLGKLTIPYVPFSRQDRVNIRGECFSLKVFAQLINNLHAKEVIVYDSHSDVVPALIENCIIKTQEDIFLSTIRDIVADDKFVFVSPDAGALKKIYKLTKHFSNCLGVVECTKERNTKTGEIKNTHIFLPQTIGYHIWKGVIVDDICDGGRTFIEIAKKLKNEGHVSRVVLCVTHGFFTKGLEVLKDIDEIWTYDPFKEKVVNVKNDT